MPKVRWGQLDIRGHKSCKRQITRLPFLALRFSPFSLDCEIELGLFGPSEVLLELSLEFLAGYLELVQFGLRLADDVSLLEVLFLPVQEVCR